MFSYGPKLNTILVIIIIANTYKALTMSQAVPSTSHILTHLHSKYARRKKKATHDAFQNQTEMTFELYNTHTQPRNSVRTAPDQVSMK